MSALIRTLAAVTTALVLSLGLVQPVHAGPAERYATAAIKKTNVERTERGLRAVRKQDCVQRFARRQAIRMARQQRMFHQDLGRVVRECRLSMAGENVAAGFPTGRAVVRAWMGSPGHRANILEPRFRIVGLAARRGGGRWYVAQVLARRA
jgi:uncharacterized protein YkwD